MLFLTLVENPRILLLRLNTILVAHEYIVWSPKDIEKTYPDMVEDPEQVKGNIFPNVWGVIFIILYSEANNIV